MPCWYYDKKELRNTPSARDGIDYATEARYRKEGARFIIDCGTKLGLRYDSCATGVVFFHRFYMFHSFKEFHRYVTAACCLFLAGKTEETPKKCKDLIKTTRSMLTDAQFAVFGEDPKEEVMTLERILLQTIKFDLMVEHPYAYLLKFAKLIKGRGSSADKAKVQKLVQMAWTFINDSMCTTLCLQWEPEVIAVSLMYLATRLNKTEITDWIGKPPGFRGKWWESLVEDVNQELLEDVCHQVLDLYQPSQPAKSGHDETPPQATARPSTSSATVSSSSKRPRTPPPGDTSKSRGPTPSKVARDDKRPASPPRSSTKEHDRSLKAPHSGSVTKTPCQSSNSGLSTPGSAPVVPVTTTASNYSQNNPYMSQQMYSSSFMSQEGSQSIQSLVGGRSTYSGTSNYTQPPPAQPPPASVPVHPTTSAYSQPSYQQATYQNAAGYQQPPPQPPNYQQPPPAVSGYSQPSTYTHSYSYPPPSQPSYSTNNQYQTPPPNYNQTYPSQYGAGQQYPASYQYNSQSYQNFTSTPSYQQPQTPQPPPPGLPPHVPPPPRQTTGLPSVRITGRPS